MNIHWITQFLGTAPASAIEEKSDLFILDIRDLVDKEGNQQGIVKEKIESGSRMLSGGARVVVCCDYGISRSNAIAAGIIAHSEKISLETAVRRVMEKIGDVEIKTDLLKVVREVINNNKICDNHGKRRILITGGRGFLGSEVKKRLTGSFSVIAPPRSELDLEIGSTQLDLIVNEESVDCIIHLANPRIFTSNVALGKTLTMLRNVIDVCVSNHIPLIYPSGWEIYSGYRGSIIADESTPPFPRGPYGETKYLCEMLIKHSRLVRGLQCTIFRSSPVYGPGGEKPKFIYNFIEKARNNETIITHRYQNGDPALDLMHIDDLISAITRIVEMEYYGELNLGTGIITTTSSVAQLITEYLKSSSDREFVQISSDVASIRMDNRKAQQVLGWKPAIPFQFGLESLIEGYNGSKTNESR